MKKVAYITLIAAFVFGVQPQEAFSTNDRSIEMESNGNANARVNFDQDTEVLALTMQTARERETVLVSVSHNGALVAQEKFIVSPRAENFEMDLTGMPSGVYDVKVNSKSLKESTRFKKK